MLWIEIIDEINATGRKTTNNIRKILVYSKYSHPFENADSNIANIFIRTLLEYFNARCLLSFSFYLFGSPYAVAFKTFFTDTFEDSMYHSFLLEFSQMEKEIEKEIKSRSKGLCKKLILKILSMNINGKDEGPPINRILYH